MNSITGALKDHSRFVVKYVEVERQVKLLYILQTFYRSEER